MASRKEQKEAARQRRLEQERIRSERAHRERRLRMLGGLVLATVILVGVVIAISSGGSSSAAPPKPTSATAQKAATNVNSLLAGIPQTANRLGSPKAPVTVTEYGDLQCPVCKSFAQSSERQLISNDVRTGKVALVYRSTPTATANGPDPNVFPTQQAAALAAGQQQRAWNYILLFYGEQGGEGTAYVTPAYLNGLARQIPGLDYAKWSADRQSPTLTQQVSTDEQAATSLSISSTPTLIVKGPKSQTQPIAGAVNYASLQSAIKSVS